MDTEFILYIQHLQDMAYLAQCMFAAKADRNFGEAEEWEHRLKVLTDKLVDNEWDYKFLPGYKSEEE